MELMGFLVSKTTLHPETHAKDKDEESESSKEVFSSSFWGFLQIGEDEG